MLRSRTTEALALVLMALTWDNAPRRSICSQVACELVTNATVHSGSCIPGGHFTVRAEIDGGGLRVEVEDQGGPWTRPVPGDEQHGHGLHIVSQLARGPRNLP
jgi:anti-sigma regulatory factor (Ser/Thr protein kinase)